MSDSTNGGAGRRILVVDDNRDSAKTLGLLLKLMGHETHLAHDGAEAIAEAERVRPELILLDIGLPKMTGHDVCRAIRQQPWGEEMVIIAVTGWGQDDDRRRSQEAGFNGHLVKPVAPEVLKQLMADVVSGALGARSVAVG
jgi:CheY-like chemotaxis protein